jgi:hypothetical protein
VRRLAAAFLPSSTRTTLFVVPEARAGNISLTSIPASAELQQLPGRVPVPCGASLTVRGSGFQSATVVSLNGKSATVTFKDASTLLVVTPALTSGPQQITITHPDGESVSLDAPLIAN